MRRVVGLSAMKILTSFYAWWVALATTMLSPAGIGLDLARSACSALVGGKRTQYHCEIYLSAMLIVPPYLILCWFIAVPLIWGLFMTTIPAVQHDGPLHMSVLIETGQPIHLQILSLLRCFAGIAIVLFDITVRSVYALGSALASAPISAVTIGVAICVVRFYLSSPTDL